MCAYNITLTLPDELVARAELAVERGHSQSVSAYIAAVAGFGEIRGTANDAIARWWAKYGEPTPEQLADAERRATGLFDRADLRMLESGVLGPANAGAILDASALLAAPRNVYVQTVIQFSVSDRRPLVIPVTASAKAMAANSDPDDFDLGGFISAPLHHAVIAGLASITNAVTTPMSLDIAHTAWEACTTGHTVLTADPDAYLRLTVPIAIEPIR